MTNGDHRQRQYPRCRTLTPADEAKAARMVYSGGCLLFLGLLIEACIVLWAFGYLY